MVSRFKNKLSPAGLIIAILALVVALGGVALAKGVIITKLNQISPSVRKQLKGKTGPQGPKGDVGAPGAMGSAGAKGDTGPAGKDGANGKDGLDGNDGEPGVCSLAKPECVLPPGATLVGNFGANGDKESEFAFATVTTALRLPSAPQTERVLPVSEGGEPTENCPGSVEEPKAVPGYLCFYVERRENASVGSRTANTSGGYIEVTPLNEPARFWVVGTWAVTASEP